MMQAFGSRILRVVEVRGRSPFEYSGVSGVYPSRIFVIPTPGQDLFQLIL